LIETEHNISIQKPVFQNRFWFKLKRQRMAFAALAFVIGLTVCSVFSDLLTRYDPILNGNLKTERYLAPPSQHFFGTDKFGRDIFSRVLYGSRVSLAIAISVVLLSMTIGIIYGTISGYFGGIVDAVMMRFLDFWLAFPAIFLIMTIVAIFQPSIGYLILILGLTCWMEIARITRAEILSLKNQDFILAVKGMGLSNFRILFKHLIPNSLTPVIVSTPLKIGEMILLESALSFLGIGVQPPMASWGNIINDGKDVLLQAWWISTFPGLFIIMTVVSFNLVAEGVRNSLGLKN
jgi:peptide/nickel transport system permease protein